jgi:trigger factor
MAIETMEDKKKIIFNADYDIKENSHVHLKITVPASEVKKEYDEIIQKYCEEVRIKGFRKGKVPADILVRKFGDALKAETSQNIIQKALKEAFEKGEHRPLPYSLPELKKKSELYTEKDFTFTICYDTFPEVELGKYKGMSVEMAIPVISDEDIDRELKLLQEQNAFVVPKEGGSVEKDNVVTIDYVEVDDEGIEIEKTRREGFTFTVGSGYNLYKIDEDIIEMKKGEEKILIKSYPEDFEFKEFAGKSVNLKVKMMEIKEKKIPVLDDEFAQDISEKYNKLSELKQDIKVKLDDMAQKRVKENTVNKVIEKVVQTSKITLPRSMVDRELELRWQNLVQRAGGNEKLIIRQLEQENKSKQALFEEWRPKVEEDVRSSLVAEEIINKEMITITEEEVNAELAKAADRQNMSVEQVREEYKKKGLMNGLMMMLQHEKLYEMLLKLSNIKKGKKVKYLDLMQGNY